jgi:hypothetical protein
VARGRLVSRTLGSSRRFASLHTHGKKLAEFSQILYVLLVSFSDDFGRLEGDAFTVKARVFPVSKRSEKEFADALLALHASGLIVWYSEADRHVIQITQWEDHQTGLHKRTKSKFPDPPEGSTNGAGLPPVLTLSSGTGPAQGIVDAYKKTYKKFQKQPYVQSSMQRLKDLEAAHALLEAYTPSDVDRILTAFLKIDENHDKAKLLRGAQRTMPMAVTMVSAIATQLGISGKAS